MLTLFELQKQFVENVTEKPLKMHNVIQKYKHITIEEQFAIYQDSILSARKKALNRIFPVCKKLVGTEFFNYIINFYIAIHSSTTPDLNDYGETFAEYLEEIVEITTLNYLSSIAHLEWNWHNLYREEPDQKFNFNKLHFDENQSENIVFKLSPSIALLTSVYPIHHIFLVNQHEPQDESSIVLQPNQQYFFIIWRKEFEKKIDVLTQDEWFILNCFKKQLSLEDISQRIINHNYEINLSLAIPQMISRGWIVDAMLNNL